MKAMFPIETGMPARVTWPLTVIPSSKLSSTGGAVPFSTTIVFGGAMRRRPGDASIASTRTRPSGRPCIVKLPAVSTSACVRDVPPDAVTMTSVSSSGARPVTRPVIVAPLSSVNVSA